MDLTTVIMTSQMGKNQQRPNRNVPTSQPRLREDFTGRGTRTPRHAWSKAQRLGKQQLDTQCLATANVVRKLIHPGGGTQNEQDKILTTFLAILIGHNGMGMR